MRPQKLIFTGLSTYTQEQTIDFTDKRFIAIIGDTGAGKSTILEAICFALYNRPTSSPYITDLIAGGGDGTVSVDFTFTVGGRRWQIARSASRSNAPSVHRLTYLDSGVQTTSARAVNAEVRRIIGLDCDTFLRAVILPQGRFQELLRMGRTDRGKILDSLLGLEQLSGVREHARTLQWRLTERLTAYQLHRRRFLDNPAEALTTAAQEHTGASQRLERLEACRDVVAGALEQHRQAGEAVAVLIQLTDLLTVDVPADTGERLHQLASLEQRYTGQRADLERLIDQLQVEQRLLSAQFEQAQGHGGDVEAAAATISALDLIIRQLPVQQQRRQQLDQEAEVLDAEQAQLDDLAQNLGRLRSEVEAADSRFTPAEQLFEQAKQRHREAVELLSLWRRLTSEAEQAHTELRTAEDDLRVAKEQASQSAGIAADAEQHLLTCAAQHATALKANAAVHAAEGLAPGDDCSVCARPVPEDFTAPTAPDVTVATAAHDTARKRVDKTGRAAAVAAAHVTAAEQRGLPAAKAKATAADEKAAEAEMMLRTIVGDADLSAADEQILKLVTEAVAQKREALKIVREAQETARGELKSAENEYGSRSAVHTERMRTHSRQRRDNLALHKAVTDAAGRLPATFAIATPLDLAQTQRQKQAAEAHLRHLNELTKRRSAAEQELRGLRARADSLRTACAREVTAPAAVLRDQLLLAAQQVNHVAAAVEVSDRVATTAPADLPSQARWAGLLLSHAQTLTRVCAKRIAHARDTERKAMTAVEEACRSVGADGEHDLQQQYLAAYGAVMAVTSRIAQAEAQLPIVDALQERIDAAAGTVRVLEQLVAALGKGKFVAEAVNRRVHVLRNQASRILLAISGGQYAFTPDLRIIDTDIAAPREVKTLSGGETFLASLALALAVVELASEATGQVEALFLDEGFGTLDTTLLRDALTTLTDHSASGRMVTVISHMRSIAEYAEDVLVVEKTLTSSRAHWADASERDTIINDDLGRGLLE
jgi:exonuclease SbcC